ncbi:MAG: glycosyl hydrolase family 8 [Fibrobacteraceae bacterium]|nr:glycosyl hydrolase family 8 [Fibrobacteraceae bacterium]
MKTTLKLIVLFSIAELASFASATVNYPFPQNSTYNGNGITLTDKASVNTALQSGFNYYLSTFYNESGNYAGIRSNEGSNEYFSEGIGYGMLLMVYFSNSTTSYQSQFDKLWAFYKASEDGNGLMNWKMGNLDPSSVWGENAATDAEMDVAAALILAAYQFGDNTYLTEAQTLLQSIRTYEFETNGLHKPGDVWNAKRNPSYVAPAYYELFKDVDASGSTFWSTTAMDANMALLETNSAEYSTGLLDNWTNDAGTGLDGYYGYDAARAPWRLSQSYYWFGNTRSYAILEKSGAWVNSQTPSSISGSISRSGTLGSDHNSTFVATLMTSLVTNSAYQSNLDAYWSEAVNLGNENYFNESMKLLCGLAVSGNMPNLTNMTTALKNAAITAKDFFSFSENEIILSGISTNNLSVTLFDINGKQIKNLFQGPVSNSIYIPIAGTNPGMYIVRESSEKGTFMHKVMVK